MSALVWEGIKEMKMRDFSPPKLEGGWVLLDSRDVGICGSEISAYLGQNELRKPPSIMGHEFSGVIRQVGRGVPESAVGKMVTVNPLVTCGVCRHCRSGNRQLCNDRKIIGVNFPGAFASQVAVQYLSCYEVNDSLLGSFAEPLATALRAMRHSGAIVGGNYLVIGAGTIGLFATKLLQKVGALNIVVSDTNAKRLEWAKKWGATMVINPIKESLADLIKNSLQDGLDAAIDAVGLQQTRSSTINLVRRGGSVVFVGLHENDSTIPGNLIVRNEISVTGSFCYTDDDFRTAVNLLNNGFIEARGGWVDIRPLDQGNEAFMEQTTEYAPFSKIVLRVQ